MFRLSDGFKLQENKQGRQTLETTSQKAMCHVTKSTILEVLQQSLARGFSDPSF